MANHVYQVTNIYSLFSKQFIANLLFRKKPWTENLKASPTSYKVDLA